MLFNTELAVSVDLDFTHMRGHVRRMFGGEMSFFAQLDTRFTSSPSEGRPRVVESKDLKKELEQLKAACEVYIMTITKRSSIRCSVSSPKSPRSACRRLQGKALGRRARPRRSSPRLAGETALPSDFPRPSTP